MKSYRVCRIDAPPSFSAPWDAPPWKDLPGAEIDAFQKESSEHRPATRVRALHDNATVFLYFRVVDRYVRSVRTGFQSDVWNDSCVEWFVAPIAGKGYFNFEVNAGGALRISFVEDPARVPGGFRKSTLLPPEMGRTIGVYHSLPSVVDPEIADPVEWYIGLSVPVATLEQYVGIIGGLSGQRWRANFNKCADETSHPHWATWNPVPEKNFHRPQDFGEMVFE